MFNHLFGLNFVIITYVQCTHFSKTLPSRLRGNIGLQFSTFLLSFFFKTGVTFAHFHACGYILPKSDIFKSLDRGYARTSAAS